MSRNLIDQDFGSDEEDDDFNPAPVEDSDNEEVDRNQVCILSGIAVKVFS